MQSKRLRMFAGPNGSGKSTIFNRLKDKIDFGFYLNADEIELKLKENGFVDLTAFFIESVPNNIFNDFLENNTLFKKALAQNIEINLMLQGNRIISKTKNITSYEASIIVSFIRDLLMSKGSKFTFETVMSHISKVDTLQKSQNLGYKNYLYFISTDDVQLNILRVKDRVTKGGHNVEESKIKNRYFNSLELLHKVIPYTHRAFIFDNSGESAKLILEVIKNKEIRFYSENIPEWVSRWLLSYLK
ncbi:MAG: zeta toxin family protein, partial [Flavobacteriaceae bacterium]|nr:zeta toxin family protein [Flavobacteriaceae bacterium]